jgi:hypothetical protein
LNASNFPPSTVDASNLPEVSNVGAVGVSTSKESGSLTDASAAAFSADVVSTGL